MILTPLVTERPSVPMERGLGSQRFQELDGLRGVAALIVVVFHVMSAFVPAWVPDQSEAVPWWADSPLAVLYNGTFAVPVFFVLSGFVLAQASLLPRKHLWLDLALRYLRLALPATASVLLACGLLHIWPTAAESLSQVVPVPWLRWTYQGEIPGGVCGL